MCPIDFEDDWSDEECLLAFRWLFDSMLEASNDGSYGQWVQHHVADDVHIVVAGKADDPSEDRAGLGKEAMVQFYNGTLDLPQDVTWVTQNAMHMLSRNTYRVDCSGKAACGEMPDKRGTTYYVMHKGVIRHIFKCSTFPEDDMCPILLRYRSIVPAHDPPLPTPPCTHNSWDSARIKDHVSDLRCRVCQAPWRIPVQIAQSLKCYEHLDAVCPMGSMCRRIHVHARKLRLRDRDAPVPLAVKQNPLKKTRRGRRSAGQPAKRPAGGLEGCVGGFPCVVDDLLGSALLQAIS
ncbi:hypothetical protein DIPPA_27188 [Diplonema papillatum]|nr:hypothetical protein DIPPA_27188 [Diplonema papillatum]